MSNYTKTVDFAAKDELSSGSSGKLIRGTEFGTEFDNIATAIATKANTAGATLTGTTTYETLNDGTTALTSTVAELNILDGVTSTAAELNILDGVTSTAAELNILDGVTSTTAELNILDGVTATTADLNILDGVTSTTAELNILDGVTSTATELNLLDGVTGIADEDNMASDSATKLATQQSIKAYVDAQVATVDTLAEVLAIGNTTGATDIEVTAAQKVQFRDSAIYINSSADGQLDIVADTEIQIAATTIDVNGTLAFDSLKGTGATTVTNILDEDNMASDSATALATQQSIKAYVDSQVGTVDTLSEILANGNTTGATDIDVDGAQKVQFRDAAIYINSSVDGQLDIVADTEIQIAATTVDLNGNLDVSGTLGVTGVATLASLVATTADINAGTIDGTVIGGSTAAAGSFTTGAFSGVVGIGTSSPTYKLNVVAAAGAQNIFQAAQSGVSNGLSITSDGSALTYSFLTGKVGIGVSVPTYKLNVLADAGAQNIFQAAQSGVSNGLSITSDGTNLTYSFLTGNVGIGTSSPATALDVVGAATFSGAVGHAAGTALLPSITQSADLNTGVWFPAADTVAASTAGTERMRIDSSGNVGIGTSSPASSLDIRSANTAVQSRGNLYVTTTSTAAINEGAQISLGGTYTGTGETFFGAIAARKENATVGDFNAYLQFSVRNTGNMSEKMRIDSSGNLLVGKTTSSFATAGTTILPSGNVTFTRSGAGVIDVNRLSSNGSLINLFKDGTTVGSIGTAASGNIFYQGGASRAGVEFGATSFIPFNNGVRADATNDLGVNSSRFKDLYLSGGVVFGTTGGSVLSKTLDDYEEGTWTPTGISAGSIDVATYTKIGDVVVISLAISGAITLTTGTIGGLPFSAVTTSCPWYFADFAVGAGEIPMPTISGTEILLRTADQATGGISTLGDLTGSYISITATYHV